MARPTLLNKDLILKAREYLGSNKNSKGILTIEGLAIELEVSRETVYAWEGQAKDAASDEEKKPEQSKEQLQEATEMLELFKEFSDIVTRVRLLQGEKLIQSGLDGSFNPMITKLLLTKHGYVEQKGVDHTTGGQPLKGALVEFVGNDPNQNKG